FVISFLIVCFGNYSFCQDEDEDLLRNDPIQGTVFLPSTHNYYSVMSTGYVINEVIKADCSSNGEEVEIGNDLIDSISISDSIIEIHLRIFDNCCYDFLWDPSFENGVLNLIYIGYGNHCACNCCFGHVLRFKKEYSTGEDEIIREIHINGKRKYKIQTNRK